MNNEFLSFVGFLFMLFIGIGAVIGIIAMISTFYDIKKKVEAIHKWALPKNSGKKSKREAHS